MSKVSITSRVEKFLSSKDVGFTFTAHDVARSLKVKSNNVSAHLTRARQFGRIEPYGKAEHGLIMYRLTKDFFSKSQAVQETGRVEHTRNRKVRRVTFHKRIALPPVVQPAPVQVPEENFVELLEKIMIRAYEEGPSNDVIADILSLVSHQMKK